MHLRLLAAVLAVLILGACGAPSKPAAHAVARQPGSTSNEFIDGGLVPSAPRLARAARPPQRMLIRSLSIDAAVEQVDFLGIPADPSNVAWFKTGPAPGEPGDAVFDGHLNWYGVPCAIFCHLRDIQPGQAIDVKGATGDTITFTVDHVDVVAATSTPPAWLYTSVGTPSMSLITCEGVYNSGGYSERLLVHSVLSSPTTSS